MKKLSVLAFATLLQATSIGILIPILTHFVLELGASQAITPAIFSVFSFCALFSTMVWGRLSDQFGRRNILICSAFGTMLSYIWLGMATELWEVFASRALAGLMAGWFGCSYAYVADVTDEENRAKGMGFIGAFLGLGFVTGPAIGAMLASSDNYYMAGWGAAVTALISLLLAIFVIKEPNKRKATVIPSLKALFNADKVRTVLYYVFFSSIIFTVVEGSYALYVYNVFGATATQIGYVLMLAGLTNIIMQGRATVFFVKRFGEENTLILSVIVKMIGLITIVYIEYFGMYLPMAIIGVGIGMYYPSVNALASKKAPAELKGSMSGLIQSIQNFARIIAPVSAGLLMAGISLTAPYTIAIVVSIIPLFFAYKLRT